MNLVVHYDVETTSGRHDVRQRVEEAVSSAEMALAS